MRQGTGKTMVVFALAVLSLLGALGIWWNSGRSDRHFQQALRSSLANAISFKLGAEDIAIENVVVKPGSGSQMFIAEIEVRRVAIYDGPTSEDLPPLNGAIKVRAKGYRRFDRDITKPFDPPLWLCSVTHLTPQWPPPSPSADPDRGLTANDLFDASFQAYRMATGQPADPYGGFYLLLARYWRQHGRFDNAEKALERLVDFRTDPAWREWHSSYDHEKWMIKNLRMSYATPAASTARE